MPSFSFNPFIAYVKIFQKLPFKSPRQPIKLIDLGKRRMKRGVLLNQHIFEKNSNISNETAEKVNFHFSQFKSMGTISCHSNQTYVTGIKKALYAEANVLNMYAKYQLYPPNGFWEEVFLNIYTNINPLCRLATYQIQQFGKCLMKRRGLLNK